MLTGQQIREARVLLGWSRADLAFNAFLPLALLEAVEERESVFAFLDGRVLAIRRVCEQAGVEFAVDGSVRMRRER